MPPKNAVSAKQQPENINQEKYSDETIQILESFLKGNTFDLNYYIINERLSDDKIELMVKDIVENVYYTFSKSYKITKYFETLAFKNKTYIKTLTKILTENLKKKIPDFLKKTKTKKIIFKLNENDVNITENNFFNLPKFVNYLIEKLTEEISKNEDNNNNSQKPIEIVNDNTDATNKKTILSNINDKIDKKENANLKANIFQENLLHSINSALLNGNIDALNKEIEQLKAQLKSQKETDNSNPQKETDNSNQQTEIEQLKSEILELSLKSFLNEALQKQPDIYEYIEACHKTEDNVCNIDKYKNDVDLDVLIYALSFENAKFNLILQILNNKLHTNDDNTICHLIAGSYLKTTEKIELIKTDQYGLESMLNAKNNDGTTPMMLLLDNMDFEEEENTEPIINFFKNMDLTEENKNGNDGFSILNNLLIKMFDEYAEFISVNGDSDGSDLVEKLDTSVKSFEDLLKTPIQESEKTPIQESEKTPIQESEKTPIQESEKIKKKISENNKKKKIIKEFEDANENNNNSLKIQANKSKDNLKKRISDKNYRPKSS
jgi:hypothetical protein